MSSLSVQDEIEKQKVLRENIIAEILETERNYVNDLHLVKEKFLNVIEQNAILTKQEIAMLFSNIETLRETNEKLLQQLEAHPRNIGYVFDENANLLKLYAVYCSNQPRISDIIKQFTSNYPKFAQLLKNSFGSETRYLGLEDFLIMPMQRITKYPLLLSSLDKATPHEDEDKQYINQACEKIRNIVLSINDRTRRVENVQKLLDVQKKFIYGDQIDIVSNERTLIHEGKLKLKKFSIGSSVSMDDSYGFLFNDKLLLCTKENNDTNGQYMLRTTIYIKDIKSITSIESEVGHKNECNITLTILIYENGKFHEKKNKIKTPTKADRDVWLKHLRSLIDNNNNNNSNTTTNHLKNFSSPTPSLLVRNNTMDSNNNKFVDEDQKRRLRRSVSLSCLQDSMTSPIQKNSTIISEDKEINSFEINNNNDDNNLPSSHTDEKMNINVEKEMDEQSKQVTNDVQRVFKRAIPTELNVLNMTRIPKKPLKSPVNRPLPNPFEHQRKMSESNNPVISYALLDILSIINDFKNTTPLEYHEKLYTSVIKSKYLENAIKDMEQKGVINETYKEMINNIKEKRNLLNEQNSS